MCKPDYNLYRAIFTILSSIALKNLFEQNMLMPKNLPTSKTHSFTILPLNALLVK